VKQAAKLVTKLWSCNCFCLFHRKWAQQDMLLEAQFISETLRNHCRHFQVWPILIHSQASSSNHFFEEFDLRFPQSHTSSCGCLSICQLTPYSLGDSDGQNVDINFGVIFLRAAKHLWWLEPSLHATAVSCKKLENRECSPVFGVAQHAFWAMTRLPKLRYKLCTLITWAQCFSRQSCTYSIPPQNAPDFLESI